MATLTFTGPRAEVIEQLEELVDKIRDEDEQEPSVSFLPSDGGGAFYLEYDPSTSENERASFDFER